MINLLPLLMLLEAQAFPLCGHQGAPRDRLLGPLGLSPSNLGGAHSAGQSQYRVMSEGCA